VKKNRVIWGGLIPVFLALGAGILSRYIFRNDFVRQGIRLGLAVALLQSFISTGALAWAWRKKYFYWVWGSGMMVRFIIFLGTAYGVNRYTSLNLAAALLSLVVATMVFLVVESLFIFGNEK